MIHVNSFVMAFKMKGELQNLVTFLSFYKSFVHILNEEGNENKTTNEMCV